MRVPTLRACSTALALLTAITAASQQPPSADAIKQELRTLRQTPDAQRGTREAQIAHEIAGLAGSQDKLRLAMGLAQLSTEGDPGRGNLQAVTDTLAHALAETPFSSADGKPTPPYQELAILQRYEGMHVDGSAADDPQFKAAAAELATQDEQMSRQDFSMKDVSGQTWTKQQLRGKVVLLNFWATWCPPCRQELPALDSIAQQYANQGLVVLALSNEDAAKVDGFLRGKDPHFHVVIDDGSKVSQSFKVDSLPRTLVFNREGKLAAVALDGRTPQQFVAMLHTAGLQK